MSVDRKQDAEEERRSDTDEDLEVLTSCTIAEAASMLLLLAGMILFWERFNANKVNTARVSLDDKRLLFSSCTVRLVRAVVIPATSSCAAAASLSLLSEDACISS